MTVNLNMKVGSASGLSIDSTKRYFLRNNNPFFLVGDSPQTMIALLSVAEADSYLSQRAAQGFNCIMTMVLGNAMLGVPENGETYDGIHPFTATLGGGAWSSSNGWDFETPNEIYFERVDAMIDTAANYGFVIMLDPCDTDSWLPQIIQNGVTKCHAYGRYLGTRYAGRSDIMWEHGNDYCQHEGSWPTYDAQVAAIGQGIKEVYPDSPQTLELMVDAYDTRDLTTDDTNWVTQGYPLDFNAAYTYQPTYDTVLRGYILGGYPVNMIEAQYEDQPNYPAPVGTRLQLRKQWFWTWLSGGLGGHFWAEHYTHQFISDWESHVQTPGALEMIHLVSAFVDRQWWNLVPDGLPDPKIAGNHRITTAGYGTYHVTYTTGADEDYATTAYTPDCKLVMVYLPQGGSATVSLGANGAWAGFAGPITASWYDPTTGNYTPITGSPFDASGSHVFTVPATAHDDGAHDWLLVLEVN